MITMRGYRAPRRLDTRLLEVSSRLIRSTIAPEKPGHGPLTGIVEVFEALDDKFVVVDKDIVYLDHDVRDDLGPGVLGRTEYSGGRIAIVLSENTYQQLRAEAAEARLTFLHEAGHAFAHPELVMRENGMPHLGEFNRQPVRHPLELDTEWQAENLAACALVPTEGLVHLEVMLQRRLGAHDVAVHFAVPSRIAKARLSMFYAMQAELFPGGVI